MRVNFAANTTIGEDSSFEGRCAISGNLRVDGRFVGPALEVEQLYVGPSGKIRTDVTAGVVVVEGVVLGNITAGRRVLLLSTARVVGKVTAPELVLQDGVMLDGECSIGSMHGAGARRFIHELYENQGEPQ